MIEWEPKAVGETVVLEADFAGALASGETIDDSVVQVTVYSGVDDEPELLVDGVTSVYGTVVSQDITGGVAGVTYLIVFSVSTSAHQILQQAGYLVVVE